MTSMTAPARTNGTKALSGARPAGTRGRPAARRRQLPLVVVGVLLVIGGALAFADASLHLGSREEVLVVSAPLAAGNSFVRGCVTICPGPRRIALIMR